jgi:hypothetical protein
MLTYSSTLRDAEEWSEDHFGARLDCAGGPSLLGELAETSRGKIGGRRNSWKEVMGIHQAMDL